MTMQPTAPSKTLFYPNISTLTERLIDRTATKLIHYSKRTAFATKTGTGFATATVCDHYKKHLILKKVL